MAFLDETGLAEVWSIIKAKAMPTKETAALYGLDEDATVDDVFREQAALNEELPKVGDIKTTIRTDLGDQWALCKGTTLRKADYPELGALYNTPEYLSTSVGDITLGTSKNNGITYGHKAYKRNILVGYTGAPTQLRYQDIYLVDLDTLETTVIAGSSIADESGAFLGMDWDGERWVVGTYYGGVNGYATFHFYTSTDLTSWDYTLFQTTQSSNNLQTSGVVKTDFAFNGREFFALMCNSSSQSKIYSFSKSLDSITLISSFSNQSGYARLIANDGFVAVGSYYYSGSVYTSNYIYPSNGNPISVSSVYWADAWVLNLSQTSFLVVPNIHGDGAPTKIVVYDTAKGVQSLATSKLRSSSYFGYAWPGTDDDVLIIELSNANRTQFHHYSVPKDGLMDAANYTYLGSTTSSQASGANVSGIADDGYYYYISGSKIRRVGDRTFNLPSISSDGVYNYIKIKDVIAHGN